MKKLNLFDALVVAIIIFLGAILFFSLQDNNESYTDQLIATVVINTPAPEVILKPAQKQQKVFLNSVNQEVTVESIRIDEEGRAEIILGGLGKIEEDRIIFNGQRILIGQKAEIHGLYFAQGYVKDVSATHN